MTSWHQFPRRSFRIQQLRSHHHHKVAFFPSLLSFGFLLLCCVVSALSAAFSSTCFSCGMRWKIKQTTVPWVAGIDRGCHQPASLCFPWACVVLPYGSAPAAFRCSFRTYRLWKQRGLSIPCKTQPLARLHFKGLGLCVTKLETPNAVLAWSFASLLSARAVLLL